MTPKMTTSPTSWVPFGAANFGCSPAAHAAEDVFADDDGVIDDDPEHEDEGEEGDHVDRDPPDTA